MDDHEIIELYFKRSQTAISETAAKYGSFCHKIADNILNNRSDSEECVNDTWLKLWNVIPPERPTHFVAYLAKITRNIALSMIRKRSSRKRKAGEYALCLDELSECISSDTGDISDDIAVKEALNIFLSKLKPEQRRIFVLRYLYVMSILEISKIMEMSEGSIKMTLMRTRQDLREHLLKEGIEV